MISLKKQKLKKKTVLSKVDDITPFKGGLAQTPIIVGLIGKVNDNVNNLISKFVGYQSKAVKEMMLIKKEIWQPNKLNLNILRRKRRLFDEIIDKEYKQLKSIRAVNKRKEEFLKLPRWIKKGLYREYRNLLFSRKSQNDFFFPEHMM